MINTPFFSNVKSIYPRHKEEAMTVSWLALNNNFRKQSFYCVKKQQGLTRGRDFMGKTRLEAFSDGVLAIIITIMVLELKVPHGDTLEALMPLIPTLLSYVLSFIYIGIYWNNHHHMFHAVNHVTGPIMWANLHLLFWLSLFPFATGWLSENHFAALPTALYGIVLLAAAIAHMLLQQTIITTEGKASVLKRAVGKDWKGKLSLVLYAFAICSTLFAPWIAQLIFIVNAIIWLVPDRRIERVLKPEA